MKGFHFFLLNFLLWVKPFPSLALSLPAAGCFIKTPEGVLFVKDQWSRRFSLPGGVQHAGENPRIAAQRETFEETGLSVQALEKLHQKGLFQVYRCQVTETLHALPVSDAIGGPARLRLSFQGQDRREVDEVFIINVNELKKKHMRFPRDLKWIHQLDNSMEVAPISIVHKWKDERPPTQPEVFGHHFSQALQKWNSWLVEKFFCFFSFLSEEELFFLVLPFLFLCVDWRLGIKLFFLLCFCSFTNDFAKWFFSLPRPFDFWPELQLKKAHYYGFPSGHSQTALVFWTFLAWYVRRFWFTLLAIAALTLTGLARIFYGVHFPHDVLGGYFLGLCIMGLYGCFEKTNWKVLVPLPFLKGWIVWALCAFLGFRFHFYPQTVEVIVVTAAVLVGLHVLLFIYPHYKTMRARAGEFIARGALGIGGLFLISLLTQAMIPYDKTFFMMFTLSVWKYLLLGLWLSLIAPVLCEKLRRKIKMV